METQNNIAGENNVKTLSTKRLVTIVGIFIALIVIGTALVRYASQSISNEERRLANENNSKSLVAASDVRSLSGTILSINGSRLTVQIQSAPSSDQSLNNRTILVNADTKLVKFSQSEESPATYTKTAVDITSIKTGDYLTAVAGENIKTLKEFTATEIQIMSKTTTR